MTGQSRSLRCTPSKRLKVTLLQEILHEEEDVTSIRNHEQHFTGVSQISEGQQVGSKPWAVECSADVHRQLEDLATKFSNLESDLSLLKQTLAPSHTRNLAAQVLLNAVHHLQLDETDHRFQDLAKQ